MTENQDTIIRNHNYGRPLIYNYVRPLLSVKLGAFRYDITFHHIRKDKETGELLENPYTNCWVLCYCGNILVNKSRGQALCSREDQFCSETGRKVSLTYALKKFARKHRQPIWKSYFDRNNKPPVVAKPEPTGLWHRFWNAVDKLFMGKFA